MARRKLTKSKTTKAARKKARKPAKKTVKRAVKKKAVKKVARKRPSATRSRRPAARRPAPKPASPPPMRAGTITHTELASADPGATRDWCATVLGWKFGQPMPTPQGPYYMWRFDIGTGGGIRANNPPEVPGSIPYCEVANIQATYAKAIAAGAQEMLAPQQLPGGMGWIAIVSAPGAVAIGFWAMK
jgi:predicted enzyme related to lactoylglutathione lyase